jgi:6-phosphogluconolactonase/glucosamine-6-phosphate isomerase/deaminase
MDLNGLIPMHNFLEFQSENLFWEFAVAAAKQIKGKNIGISGGSASKIINFWDDDYLDDKHLFVIDERKIDMDSEFSNCKKFRNAINSGNILCPYHDDNFVEQLPDQLDGLIMGVGPDGHIGSLFSIDDLSKDGLLIDSMTDRFDVKNRVSLSMDYLLKSKKVICLLKGPNKYEIWNKIKSDQNSDSPIEYFARHYGQEITFCLLK